VLTGEMPPQDLSLRMLTIEAEESATMPPNVDRLILKEKKKKLAAAAVRLQNAPVQFLEVAGWPVEKVVATVRAISRTMPLKMVLLDYLQLLKSAAATEAGSDRVGEVAAVSNALRDFAHASNFPLLVLAQINRQYAKEAQKKPETLPTVADLKGSGDIEQDADAVLLLHRPEKCLPQNATPQKKAELAGKAYISVDKNRHGEGGVVALKWRGYCQKFEETGEQ
jgi:replicative DNA helicase